MMVLIRVKKVDEYGWAYLMMEKLLYEGASSFSFTGACSHWGVKKVPYPPTAPYIRLQTFLTANGENYQFLQFYDFILCYETLQYFIGTGEDFYCQFLLGYVP